MEPKEKYREDFELIVDYAAWLSGSNQGINCSWAEGEASIAFSRLSANAIAVCALIPGATNYHNWKEQKLWDAGSIAVLCRSLVEGSLAVAYLLIPTNNSAEAECRELLWKYHDLQQRLAVAEIAIPKAVPTPDRHAMKGAVGDLWNQLQNNSHFLDKTSGKSPHYKKEFKNGKHSSYMSKIEMCRALGISERLYSSAYKLLCNFTHFSPAGNSIFSKEGVECHDLLTIIINKTSPFLVAATKLYANFTKTPIDNEEINQVHEYYTYIADNWDRVVDSYSQECKQ